MSKKERKQAKARAILDKEMLEAKAEESTQTRLKFASDVSNLLFAIYFRLIKDPAGGKGPVLLGDRLGPRQGDVLGTAALLDHVEGVRGPRDGRVEGVRGPGDGRVAGGGEGGH